MNRLLLIVAPQIDFISGSLPVEGAAQAMEGLANYLRKTDGIELFGKDMFNVLLPYCASIDGGAALTQFTNTNGIRCTY